ncbi:hypothetical protein PSDA2_00007 [Salmonella phage PSDA-2]|uniref:Uncharacterized protein n=2 Tax=Cornellvirus TaxID=1910993 RepID=A0A9E7N107_9CAUD|nr:hypothetical protein PF619_gp27 [Salmonella phage GRNsp27]YP_010582439.1 hypothetical protein PF623_gp07 [Salmonella phage vB_SenS_SE1]QBJ03996.1 hypothetical protein [Salmonella phage vB_SenS_SE1]QVW27641.1 hypothetical protein PSDA2_00007 [Salmonella phage PSDA-2]USW07561.1 hypothetical protein [Salmonella phage GRNsp27]
MATLKDHQQAMVDLLASGSGIPASASRLAHAMHDVLSAMLGDKKESFAEEMTRLCNERIEATTPGLNDKALAADVEVFRPKQEIKESLLRAKERRIKGLDNTVRQLRASNAKLRKDNEWLKDRLSTREDEPEQAGCRKPDTQVDCPQGRHDYVYREAISAHRCLHCGDVQK